MPTASLLVALVTYVTQLAIVLLVFLAITRGDVFSSDQARGWLAAAMVLATVVWTAAHLVLTARERAPYFDLPPGGESMTTATDNVRSAMAESGATSSQPPRNDVPRLALPTWLGVLFYGPSVGSWTSGWAPASWWRRDPARRRTGDYMIIMQLQRQTAAEQAQASNKTSDE